MTWHGQTCSLCWESIAPLYQCRDKHLCLDCFHAFTELVDRYAPWDEALKLSRAMKDVRRQISG
jgi:hypothetical protein